MTQEPETGAVQSRGGEPEVLPLAADPNPADLGRATDAAPAPARTHHHGAFSLQSFFTVVIFSIFVITFVVQAFQIPTSSMENTLLVGDFLLVDKLHFAGAAGSRQLLPYAEIRRGDIIVFYFPVDPSQFLVKRVIGLPGDHLRLRNKTVYLNGAPLQEAYAIHAQWTPDPYRDNFPAYMAYARGMERRWRYELQRHVQEGEVVVPKDQYFVMGDNRDDSEDSRYWGFVPRANIIGRPLVIYLSVKGSEPGRTNDKLLHSGQMAHLLQLARWDRMFRLVR
jgi:signal peptidase I